MLFPNVTRPLSSIRRKVSKKYPSMIDLASSKDVVPTWISAMQGSLHLAKKAATDFLFTTLLCVGVGSGVGVSASVGVAVGGIEVSVNVAVAGIGVTVTVAVAVGSCGIPFWQPASARAISTKSRTGNLFIVLQEISMGRVLKFLSVYTYSIHGLCFTPIDFRTRALPREKGCRYAFQKHSWSRRTSSSRERYPCTLAVSPTIR